MARLGRAIPRRLAKAPVVYVPGEILDIGAARANHFSLQYAQTGAGSPDTATQADIAAGFTLAPYFAPSVDGQRVQFFAQLDAPTTAGASFSRSELREVNADGSDAAWDANADSHTLRVKFTPTHLPAVTPAAVFAQMFDTVATADRISIRTQLVSGTARLRIRINGSTVALDATSPINPGSNDLATGVANIVGVEWDFKIVLTGGEIAIYVNDMVTPVVTRPVGTLAANGAANYFKAGVYNQANTGTGDSGTDWGSAELRDLQVAHTPTVTGSLVTTLPALAGATAATLQNAGTLTATLPTLAGAAAATVTDPATAVAALPALTGTTTGTVTDAATMPAALPALSASSAATVTDPATLTTVLPVLTGSLTAGIATTGTLTGTLPALVGTSAGDTVDPGVTTGALPALTGAFTATSTTAGVLDGTLPTLTGQTSATVSDPATVTGTLPGITGTTAASVTATGALNATLPVLAGRLDTSNQIDADLTAALPELTGQTTATVTDTGTLAAVLPALVGAFTGTVGQDATTTGSLPALTGAFTVTATNPGTLTGVLPALVGDVATAEPNPGTLAASLPALSGQMTAAVTTAGQLVGVLPELVGSFTATELTEHGPLHAGPVTPVPAFHADITTTDGLRASTPTTAAVLHAELV